MFGYEELRKKWLLARDRQGALRAAAAVKIDAETLAYFLETSAIVGPVSHALILHGFEWSS